MRIHTIVLLMVLGIMGMSSNFATGADPGVLYEGLKGPGLEKRIVLLAGDEEYRSEETMPQLGKILATRHGFTCTVLFPINKKTGEIDPNTVDNIPGLEALGKADLVIMGLRFRTLPNDQMRHIDAYIRSGKPIIGLRTSTHAFKIADGPYRKWGQYSNEAGYEGGFGRVVLGEKWIKHHGDHGKQSTRGLIVPEAREHPITRGIENGDIWGPTDVYAVRLPLPEDCHPIIMGQVLKGMKPTDAPVAGNKNEPMMPVAWTRLQKLDSGKQRRVFTTTMGASQDLASAGVRRLVVNAAYWCLEMEESIPERGSSARLIGKYAPTPFGFGSFTKGVRPEDHHFPK